MGYDGCGHRIWRGGGGGCRWNARGAAVVFGHHSLGGRKGSKLAPAACSFCIASTTKRLREAHLAQGGLSFQTGPLSSPPPPPPPPSSSALFHMNGVKRSPNVASCVYCTL